jgi:3-oxoacyl-[acyl-carrier protein] reductase
MPRLDNKTAVITGSSSGIGRAIALAFAREGAHVIINYNRSSEKAKSVVSEISSLGGRASIIQADISKTEEVTRMINSAVTELGRIDIWVNNAGADILTGKGSTNCDFEKLQQLITVDLKGTIACCWGLVPVMQAQGHGVIINMSWDLAIHGFTGRNPQMFAAVKAGVLGFSRSFAKTYGPEIRVNILAPGWIKTTFANEYMDKEFYAARIREIPAGRFGTPEEVAETAVFLASDESSYLTGEMIKINGGVC